MARLSQMRLNQRAETTCGTWLLPRIFMPPLPGAHKDKARLCIVCLEEVHT